MNITLRFPGRPTVMLVLVVVGVLNIIFWFPGPWLYGLARTHFIPFSSSWQAVYLTSGDMYVGHVRGWTSTTVLLDEAYLVKITNQAQDSQGTQSFRLTDTGAQNLSLVRWGFFQPFKSAGNLVLNRSQILFWEKLDSDAQVVEQIKSATEAK